MIVAPLAVASLSAATASALVTRTSGDDRSRAPRLFATAKVSGSKDEAVAITGLMATTGVVAAARCNVGTVSRGSSHASNATRTAPSAKPTPATCHQRNERNQRGAAAAPAAGMSGTWPRAPPPGHRDRR